MKQNKKIAIISFILTTLIFLTILLWGIFGNITGNEMGYVVLNFYLIMPITSFVVALILGLKDAYFKKIYTIVFGIFGFFIPILVFENSLGAGALFFSFIPAVLGLVIGILINRYRSNK